MPERPKKETPLLPFPKTGKDVAHWHFGVAVLPDVLEFEHVVDQHVHERANDSDYRKTVNRKHGSAKISPTLIAFYSEEVRDCCHQRTDESQDHKGMAKIAGPNVFSDVVYFQCVGIRWSGLGSS